MAVQNIVSVIFEAAKSLYAQIEQAKANNEQCSILKENIEIIMSSIIGLSGISNEEKESYQKGFDELFGVLIKASQMVHKYSTKEAKKIDKAIQFVIAKQIAQEFEDINKELDNAIKLLHLGLSAQLTINEQQTKVERQKNNEVLKQQQAALLEAVQKQQEENQQHNKLVINGVSGLYSHQEEKLNAMNLKVVSINQKLVTMLQAFLPNANNNHSSNNTISKSVSVEVIPFSSIRLETELHKGKQSSTYTAYYQGETYVAKRINVPLSLEREPAFIKQVQDLERFRKSPRIISLHGIFYEKEHKGLLIEYFPNGCLSNVLENNKLPIEQRKQIARDVASGLFFLHDNEEVHGQLEHSHIYITGDWRAKISSFRTSKVLESALMSITSISNKKHEKDLWRAPEIYISHISTTKSDIYSLGILLLEVFSQEKLLSEKNKDKLLSKIPQEIVKLVNQCLQDDPELRPDAADVVEQLDNIKEFSPTPERHFEYGCMYEKQNNFQQAIACYKHAAEGKVSRAKLHLATLYIHGYSQQPSEEAKHLAYQLLCDIADEIPRAMYTKGMMLEKGDGVEKNLDKALECYQQAVNMYDDRKSSDSEQQKITEKTKQEIQERILKIELSQKQSDSYSRIKTFNQK